MLDRTREFFFEHTDLAVLPSEFDLKTDDMDFQESHQTVTAGMASINWIEKIFGRPETEEYVDISRLNARIRGPLPAVIGGTTGDLYFEVFPKSTHSLRGESCFKGAT
jgi:hypothetical protein